VTDLIGAEGRDVLVGTSGNDHLQGLGGDDSLLGQAGDDLMEGGEGNDYLQSFSGSDVADGGAGDDLIDIGNYDSAAAAIQAHGGEGNDVFSVYSSGPHSLDLDGGAGDDEVRLALLQAGSVARITLGSGSDSIVLTPFNSRDRQDPRLRLGRYHRPRPDRRGDGRQ
jgi:Ca2+-binding RTX toxin-like protein